MTKRLTSFDVYEVPVESIFYDGDFNCRAAFTPQSVLELAQSIKKNGLQFPITLQPMSESLNPVEGFDYRLISGYRRFVACKTFLKWDKIPSTVRRGLTDKQARILNFNENLERKQLNMTEEALWLARNYPDASLRQIASEIKRPTRWIHSRLRLARMPERVQELASAGWIAACHLEELVKLRPKEQVLAAERIAEVKAKNGKLQHLKGIRRFRYRKTKNEIMEMVAHMMQVGIDGLILRFGAWCAGYIPDEEFSRDIEKEVGNQQG